METRIDPGMLSTVTARYERVQRVAKKAGVALPELDVRYAADRDGMWAFVTAPDVKVTGKTGWTIVAKVVDGVVQWIGDARDDARDDDRPEWRENVCDECGTRRDRIYVWLLERDGEVRRVGSTCLDAYAVPDIAGLLAALDGWRAELDGGRRDEDEEDERGRRSSTLDLDSFLRAAHALTVVYGYQAGGGTRDLLRAWWSGDREVDETVQRYRAEVGKIPELDVDAVIKWAEEGLDGDFGDNVRAAISSAQRGGARREHHGLLACLPHLYTRETEKRAQGSSGPSKWIATAAGEKVAVDAVVVSVKATEGRYGWTFACTFKAGDDLVFWRASKAPGINGDRIEVGDQMTIAGAVKALDTWRDGTKVTVLTRCKLK